MPDFLNMKEYYIAALVEETWFIEGPSLEISHHGPPTDY